MRKCELSDLHSITLAAPFFEQVAAREMIRQKTEGDHEVTHDELLQYYHDHLGEYEYSGQGAGNI